MICYHNLGEIAHDVVTACLVRIGIKKRARCCDYWDLIIRHIYYAYNTLAIVSVAKWPVVQLPNPLPCT